MGFRNLQEKLEKIYFAVLFIYTFVVRKMHERITFTFDSLAFLCVSAKILPEFWQDAKLIFAGTMHCFVPSPPPMLIMNTAHSPTELAAHNKLTKVNSNCINFNANQSLLRPTINRHQITF